MAAVKAGDRVCIISRDVTADDEKSGLYYSYFGDLTGIVDRVYDDNTVCVDVDLESLPDDTRIRHKAMEDAERERWLDSLSNEARNRLTPQQKQLKMSYKLLVADKDLKPLKDGGKPKGAKSSVEASGSSKESAESDKEGPARAPEPEASAKTTSIPTPKAAAKPTKEQESAAKRLSEADLSAAEEEYLKSIIKNMNV